MKLDINKISIILVNKSMNFEDLRKKANISIQTLSNIKSGKNVSLDTAIKITKALNIDAEDIFLNE
ncbi:MAG: helix-turn-helix transcriptional regulator [Clostridiales bacterium]|nr:helix-turn-helix transcriptional regulator [Clostridiales bacterium]